MASVVPESPGATRRRAFTRGLAILFVTAYVLACFVTPQPWFPAALNGAVAGLRTLVRTPLNHLLDAVGWAPLESSLGQHGIYLLVAAILVPWVVMGLLRRGRPGDLGLRRPNVIGWRLWAVGYLVSLPFQIWMVRGPILAESYLFQWEQVGWAVFVGYYFANMLGEHFFFHGIVLAAARPGGRWPPPPAVYRTAARPATRSLQWLGLAQPTEGTVGLKRIVRWIGLPEHCVSAIIVSGLLFGAIHLGKDPRELLLSVPGGVALGYVAYRANSWLIPFALHLMTAGTAFLIVLMTR